jgi:KaiC/GvpD/RAD55 family RecA-like ATPase
MIREIWDEQEDDLFRQAEDEQFGRPAKAFSTVTAAELLAMKLPPPEHIWGPGIITRGQLTAVIGQGGTGKSRLLMQAAVEERAGLAPLGFALPQGSPQLANKWLFVGTENSMRRLQGELGLMLKKFNDEQRAEIGRGIHFHVLKEDDDMDILLREDNLGRWQAMLEEVGPTVVVVDPFGDIHPGDINKPAEVRATVRAFMRVCRAADHEMAMVIIHHARAGRNNIAGAVGWDQGAFSLGAKDITTMARVQINVTFTDPEDWGKVMLSLGKANDMERFEPRGFVLNRETMSYELDADFDLEEWKADLDGKRSAGTKVSIAQVLQEIVETGGPEPRKKWDWLKAVGDKFGGVTGKTIQSKITAALKHGYLREDSKGTLRVTEKYQKQQEAAEDGRK